MGSEPALPTDGLAVGMFFRQRDSWAFASLQKAVPGRNVMESGAYLEHMLQDLVYPANQFWDQTTEQQQLIATGAFGEAGMHGKAVIADQITQGKLPCVASRKDKANLLLGHMTPDALEKVSKAPGIRQDVKQTAGKLLGNEQLANQIQGMAQAEKKMEKAGTDEERKQIASEMKAVKPTAPTVEESKAAVDELASLFDNV